MDYRCSQTNEPGKKHAKEKQVRFPTDGEIEDLLDDAIPIAKKKAAIHKMDLETWMLADAICKICPEMARCDQQEFEAAVERVFKQMQVK